MTNNTLTIGTKVVRRDEQGRDHYGVIEGWKKDKLKVKFKAGYFDFYRADQLRLAPPPQPFEPLPSTIPAWQQADYDRFVKGLTQLSRKYGVVLKSIVEVCIADEPGEFRDVTYHGDITNGDLYPEWPDED